MNSEMPLTPGPPPGRLRQHEVHDVLGQLVVTAGDPHLGSGDPVGAVGGGNGLGGDVGQRRAGVGLRQAHGAEVAALEHRPDPGVDLLLGAVFGEQVGVADGQERRTRSCWGWLRGRTPSRPARPPSAAACPPIDSSNGPAIRPASLKVSSASLISSISTTLPSGPTDGSFWSPFLLCGAKHFVAMSLGKIEHGVEGVARVLGEVVALGQFDDVEPLVEQKVDITPREEFRHVRTAFRDLDQH